MGHVVGTTSIPIDRHFSELKVENDLKEMGTLYGPIRWIDKLFPTIEEAEEYLNRADRGFYDNLAVKYGTVNHTAKTAKLERDIADLQRKIMEYKKAHSVHSFKAEYIGCQKCGSRLNKKYIPKEECPLCGVDLRSKTTLDTLNGYFEKLEAKRVQLDEAKKAAGTKQYWLIKYDLNDDHPRYE
jgi:DNA repair exonuclease SbcCD ATPase subunit